MERTAKRFEVLEFIIRFKSLNDGNTPSVRHIAKELGYASQTPVHEHIKVLEQQDRLIKRLYHPGDERSYGIAVLGGKWCIDAV